MVKNGFYDFLNWFDDRAWYPLGRIVGGPIVDHEQLGRLGLVLGQPLLLSGGEWWFVGVCVS